MKEKESFVFHKDWYEAIKGLEDGLRLEVYDGIMQHVYGCNDVELSPMAQMAMSFILPQIEREREKYEVIKQRRSEAGKKHRGNQYIQLEQNGTNGTNVQNLEQNGTNGTNGTDSVSVSVSDSVNVSDSVSVSDSGSLEPNGSMKEGYDNIPPLPPSEGNVNVNVPKLLDKIKALEMEIEDLQKKKRSTFTPPTEKELTEHITEKGYHFSAEDFIAFYESKGWMIGKNKMKDWKAACRTWERSRTDTKQTGMSIGIMHDNSDKEKYKKMELW